MTEHNDDLKSLFKEAFADSIQGDDTFTREVERRVERRRSQRTVMLIGVIVLGLAGIYIAQIEGEVPQPHYAASKAELTPEGDKLEIDYFEDSSAMDDLDWPGEYGALAMMINEEME